MTTPTKEKLAPTEIPFNQLLQAFDVFKSDYAIVGHKGDPLVSVFDSPRPGTGHDHKYTVTTIPENMGETEFKKKIGKNSVVVIDMCMDARGAVDTYNQISVEAKQKFGENVVIILLAHGGGIVQAEQDMSGKKLHRVTASKDIYGYLTKYQQQIKAIYAGGHDCRCGACAFYADGEGIPEQLGCENGSKEEITAMAKLVQAGVKNIIPQVLRIRVQPFVAHFNLDPNDSVQILKPKNNFR